MVACGCGIVEGVKGRRGRSSGQYQRDPPTGTATGTGMTRADQERAAVGRCYEVDIGDRVEIDTHDEGTVQGEVTNMLWRGELGFRQPDALEVQWKGSRGELHIELETPKNKK